MTGTHWLTELSRQLRKEASAGETVILSRELAFHISDGLLEVVREIENARSIKEKANQAGA